MHRAAAGDPGQPVDLLRSQIPLEGELRFDDIDLGIGIALAILAVPGMDLVSAELDLHPFHYPAFALGVHLDGHHLAGAQGGQQQTIRIGPGILPGRAPP